MKSLPNSSMSPAELHSALSLVAAHGSEEVADMRSLKLEGDLTSGVQQSEWKNNKEEDTASSSIDLDSLSAGKTPSLVSRSSSSSQQRPWQSSMGPPTPDQSIASSQSTPWSTGFPVTPKSPDVFVTRDALMNTATEVKHESPGRLDLSMGGRLRAQVTTPQMARYLMVSGFPKTTTPGQIRELLSRSAEVKNIVFDQLESKSYIVVIIYDCREAYKLYQTLNFSDTMIGEGLWASLQCYPIQRRVLEKEMGVEALMTSRADYLSEAEIIVRLMNQESTSLSTDMQDILLSFGDIVRTVQLPTGEIVVEYCDSRHAEKAVAGLHGAGTENVYIDARPYSDDPFDHPVHGRGSPFTQSASVTLGSAAYRQGSFLREAFPRSISPGSSRTSASQVRHVSSTNRNSSSTYPSGIVNEVIHQKGDPRYLSPTDRQHPHISRVKFTPGYSYNPYGAPGATQLQALANRAQDPSMIRGTLENMDISARARLLQGQATEARSRTKGPQEIPAQNMIIRDRITSGADRRTTVMIKDVPNKLSRDELVKILRGTVPGGFDFVYLRFDFVNGCNVGYAFVNFTNTTALRHFVDQKAGKRWDMFHSDKVLQVSYANIQGKAALIAKFRNSEVMTKTEDWRPQLFYSSGVKQGEPEDFPPPDHPLYRSSVPLASTSRIMHYDTRYLSTMYDYEYAPKMFDSRF